MEPGGSMPRSQGLSNNSYPELDLKFNIKITTSKTKVIVQYTFDQDIPGNTLFSTKLWNDPKNIS